MPNRELAPHNHSGKALGCSGGVLCGSALIQNLHKGMFCGWEGWGGSSTASLWNAMKRLWSQAHLQDKPPSGCGQGITLSPCKTGTTCVDWSRENFGHLTKIPSSFLAKPRFEWCLLSKANNLYLKIPVSVPGARATATSVATAGGSSLFLVDRVYSPPLRCGNTRICVSFSHSLAWHSTQASGSFTSGKKTAPIPHSCCEAQMKIHVRAPVQHLLPPCQSEGKQHRRPHPREQFSSPLMRSEQGLDCFIFFYF